MIKVSLQKFRHHNKFNFRLFLEEPILNVCIVQWVKIVLQHSCTYIHAPHSIKFSFLPVTLIQNTGNSCLRNYFQLFWENKRAFQCYMGFIILLASPFYVIASRCHNLHNCPTTCRREFRVFMVWTADEGIFIVALAQESQKVLKSRQVIQLSKKWKDSYMGQ